MSKRPLTAIAIGNLKSRPQRYEVPDPGCAGLRVVVFPSRRKSFVVRYRFRGVQKKLTLGACLIERSGEAEPADAPELDTPLSLLAARQLAVTALRQARAGEDPCAAKQRRRQEERAAESDTLAAIAAEYLRREGPRLRTLNQRRSDLDLLCAGGKKKTPSAQSAGLGRLPVAEITRGQYTRVLDTIADHNGPVRSDRCLSALRTLLAWHAKRSDFVSPLVRGGRRTSIAERARARILSDDELRKLWTAAEQAGVFGAYLRFTLLTATRRGESAGLRRSELSDGGRTWIVPAQRYKSKRDTLIPLSAAAQRIVATQPILAGDHVFSATGERALGGFDDRKAEFDEASGVANYRLHDLRRTSRTLLSRAGISADIGERCLGHALVGVRGTYDRHAYESEKRDAFEALAKLIERIVRPQADVADMVAERRKRRRH
jgi:integrase